MPSNTRLVLTALLVVGPATSALADTTTPPAPRLAATEPTAPGMVAPAEPSAGPTDISAGVDVGGEAATTYMATAAIGTTVAYRPNQGSFAGPQRDVGVGVGVGVITTEKTSVNLDLAVTFGEEGYLSTAIGATGSLTLHPNVYVVLHTLVSVDPAVEFYLQPGAGVTHAFGTTAPFVEVTAASAIGHGKPDVGIGVAVGASRTF